jgi:sulfate/thiosulfate transport system substrate-binding protein
MTRGPISLLAGLVLACSPPSQTSEPADSAPLSTSARKDLKLLNVSYDPTRELYAEIDAAFAKEWERTTGGAISIEQSHGGSGKQARAVIDGLEADVVTLALAYDIDAIARSGRIATGWASRLPHRSAPYTSTIVFLVRKGNPKGIRGWDDLVKPGVQVITPNPRTSGGARWNYLAAWGYALGKAGIVSGSDATPSVSAKADAQARQFVRDLYRNVRVLDSGARGATTTFVERGIGDVLLAWENEALLAVKKKLGPDSIEIITPSVSILAEPPVAVVDRIVDKRGTREAATAYLSFLYSEQGQKIGARHFYRPIDPTAVTAGQFPAIELFTIDERFGGWAKAQARHFDSGGIFDQINARVK